MPSSGQSLNAVMAKYDQLKKSWEGKKLDDVGKQLLELKIGLTMLSDGDKPMDERVIFFEIKQKIIVENALSILLHVFMK